MTRRQLIPDATIRHLRATILMDWNCPLTRPHELNEIRRLIAGDGVGCSEAVKASDQRGYQQITTCCGEGSASRLLEFCSQPKLSLQFDDLQNMQCMLVGREQSEFRCSTAFTTVRQERYAWFESLERMFRLKIQTDAAEEIHPIFKAIRIYLDIQFVHPFVDGNSRAGMLWFAFHCWRGGFCLPDFRKIHGYGFIPGNRLCYRDFCDFVIGDLL